MLSKAILLAALTPASVQSEGVVRVSVHTDQTSVAPGGAVDLLVGINNAGLVDLRLQTVRGNRGVTIYQELDGDLTEIPVEAYSSVRVSTMILPRGLSVHRGYHIGVARDAPIGSDLKFWVRYESEASESPDGSRVMGASGVSAPITLTVEPESAQEAQGRDLVRKFVGRLRAGAPGPVLGQSEEEASAAKRSYWAASFDRFRRLHLENIDSPWVDDAALCLATADGLKTPPAVRKQVLEYILRTMPGTTGALQAKEKQRWQDRGGDYWRYSSAAW